MYIQNRMQDVHKLCSNVCQDFIKMILRPDWQHELYKKAKDAVEKNLPYKDKYIAVYEYMRSYGIEDYQTEDMDITLIYELCCNSRKTNFTIIDTIQNGTITALKKIVEDKNTYKSHNSENEDAEELYLRGLLALCNLKSFVRTVDKAEVLIDDNTRLTYRRRYIERIEKLMNLLDDERLELRQIDKDIRIILESENPDDTWYNMFTHYLDRWKMMIQIEANQQPPNQYHKFIIRASDAGIVKAHILAADFYVASKNYVEAERCLYMRYNSEKEMSFGDAKNIVRSINSMIKQTGHLSDGILKMIDGLNNKDFKIVKLQNGFYRIEVKET